MKTCLHFRQYLAHFFLDCEVFQTKVVEKIETRILYSVTFSSPENRAVYKKMWKNMIEPDRSHIT